MCAKNLRNVSASEAGQVMYLMGAEVRERRKEGVRSKLTKAQKADQEYMESIRREVALAEGTRRHEVYTQAMLSSMEREGQKQNLVVRLLKLLGRVIGIRANATSS